MLSGCILGLGHLLGGYSGVKVAFVIAILMNFVMYFFSERIVLSLYHAHPLDPEEYDWVYATVAELCQTMHIPMPKLWIIKSHMANAFATGRSPSHASVAITTGILKVLDQNELRGVLAHELSHIKNRDVLVATIAATLATTIGYLAHMIHHMALWSSLGSDRDRKQANPFIMIFVAILMPIAGSLIQLAISRSREYLADETGAYESKDPLALASALEKLHNHIPQAHLDPENEAQVATSTLFIVHPFSTRGMTSLFSTHPPVEKRIARLKNLFEKRIY